MRHFLLAPPVTVASFGMLEAASPAALVAAAGLAHRGPASVFGTALGTINLAPIAHAADHDLHSAAVAVEQSPGTFHRRSSERQCDIDRDTAIVEYSPCTRARHGVGTASV
ncbi:MAG TPA: hypothetical protein PLR37_02200 [Candidatus Accumulibacter phosphatis]|jgi:hypothetical protein|nr:hypothetical protein [Candidatus Accumulibacter phosphatis]